MCDRSGLAQEARARAEKLGFQLHREGEKYRLVTPQGGWHQSDDLESLMRWLDVTTSKIVIVPHTGDGP